MMRAPRASIQNCDAAGGGPGVRNATRALRLVTFHVRDDAVPLPAGINVIFRDDNGSHWECTELDDRDGEGGVCGKDYRVLRCVHVNHPEATPRYVSLPIDLDISDPSVLRQLFAWPHRRE